MSSRPVRNDDPQPKEPEAFVDTIGELNDTTPHSGFISPVFGDIAAKMKLAIDQEVQRLLAMGIPIIVHRGNGIEELYSLPED
jgi:hypothetical protein